MKFHHLFFVIVVVKANSVERYCDVIGDDPTTQCYTKEILITMAHSPHQIAVDTDTNTLYFSFDSGQGDYMPAMFNIDKKDLIVLKGVKDAFAMSYDHATKDMYFGGTHGIYRYNVNAKSLKRLNVKNLDIWWLFVKNGVYFIKFPSLNTYFYNNGSIKFFDTLTDSVVQQLVLDRDDNKLFINNSGLFGVKPNGHEAILIKEHPRFVNMATDRDGYVYVCSEDGLFIVSKIVKKLKKLINVHGVLGFTFDKYNNFIYSDSHEIVRLLPIFKKQ